MDEITFEIDYRHFSQRTMVVKIKTPTLKRTLLYNVDHLGKGYSITDADKEFFKKTEKIIKIAMKKKKGLEKIK